MDFDSELVTDAQREACAVLVMRTMLADRSNGEGEAFEALLLRFARSRTYAMLFDYETRVWAEGPDYLGYLWDQERQGC